MSKSLKINALLNGTKQILSVMFPLITFPYVSRVLRSEEWGRFSFSASLVAYFSLLASFGIYNYGVREGARLRDNKTALENLVTDLFFINFLSTIVSFSLLTCLVLFNNKINPYKSIIFVQSLSIFLTFIGLDYVNVVYEDYLYITLRYIVIQIISIFFIFVFVRNSSHILRYCIITVFASNGGNLLNIIYVRKYVKIKFVFRVDFKKYFIPLLILFVNSLAITIYVSSDITMLGLYKNDKDVGIYSFSSKVYNIIKYFINAVLMVTVPRLTYLLEKQGGEFYKEKIYSIFDVLSLFIFAVAMGIFVLSDSIVFIAGGNDYYASVSSLRILSFAIVFALFASINTNCILIVNRLEKYCLVGTLCSAGLNVILNCLLIPKMGDTGCAITTVVAEFVNLIIQIFFCKRKLKYIYRPSLKIVITDIYSCVCVIVGFLIINIFLNSDSIVGCILRILLVFFVSVFLYIIFLVITKNKYVFIFISEKYVNIEDKNY